MSCEHLKEEMVKLKKMVSTIEATIGYGDIEGCLLDDLREVIDYLNSIWGKMNEEVNRD